MSLRMIMKRRDSHRDFSVGSGWLKHRMSVLALWLCLAVTGVIGQQEKDTPRPVVPATLINLINQADKVVVHYQPLKDAQVLYTSTKKEDIAALAKAAAVVKPEGEFHCMCLGSPSISVYQGNKLLVQITNHHGQAIRCSQLWDSDAMLADAELLLKWFEERKMPAPRAEVEAAKVRAVQRDKDWERWLAGVPPCLKDIWQDESGPFGRVNTKPLLEALSKAYPQKKDQILALYGWRGSGTGRWSGIPGYEVVAEKLLLEYDVADLVAAVDVAKMSPEQMEGAARIFGGWDFSQQHPDGLKQVPADMKKAFWNHVKDTNDEDKLGRAKRAFR